MERIDTVIVGGGQAGLATSYYLTQEGHEHLVLEQAAQAANVWRHERWDSFTLVTPNWTLKMPGAEHNGADRDGFLPRDEVVAYFERYIIRFRLPIQFDTRVLSVEPLDKGGYRVTTPESTYAAQHVVIATGFEQHPSIPALAANLTTDITSMHSSHYRNPESLPPGGVLVVGSAQSGAQIAEELYQRGRQVYLSVGSAGRVPRRYRGRDIVDWLARVGFFDLTPEKLPVPKEQFSPPHVSGTQGGHTLNLHQFARDGVTLLGHLRGASGNTISLAPDLPQRLANIDAFERDAQAMIDGYIETSGLDAPPEELPRLQDGFDQPVIEALDLHWEGITTIIWATGFTHEYGLVKLPAVDRTGFPIQNRGVTPFPGLYFVGMPWMPSLKSGILAGVGEFAAEIAEQVISAGRAARVVPTGSRP
jgi:putative flavoprotein involved in K+ transport